MEQVVGKLSTALALEGREHLALVGAGGKTTLMFALAEELRRADKRVLTSTTTKVWQEQASNSPYVGFVKSNSPWKDALMDALQTHGHAFLGDTLLETGKVRGISPTLADELYQDEAINYLIVEADGAAGHPVKAPAKHEPIISTSVTKVVGMIGLEALGKELSPEIVFRIDVFRKLTRLAVGDRLAPSVLSRLVLNPEGLFKGTPASARRVAFLNKLDLLQEKGEARKLADLVLGDKRSLVDRVVIGSVAEDIYEIVGG